MIDVIKFIWDLTDEFVIWKFYDKKNVRKDARHKKDFVWSTKDKRCRNSVRLYDSWDRRL